MGNVVGRKTNSDELDQDEHGHGNAHVPAQVSSSNDAHISPSAYHLPLMFTAQNNSQESETPSSPVSSYSNPDFTLDDLHEKLPELPPPLQQRPLNPPAAATNRLGSHQEPLSVNLNHLYTQRAHTGEQPTFALSCSSRFGSKFVTTVLYKPLKKRK